jgi:hypothetical protein
MNKLLGILLATGLLAASFPATGQEEEQNKVWILQEQELVADGGLYEFAFDYDQTKLAQVMRGDTKETGYKFSIALPPDFDPNKPQRVFVVTAAGNNAGETQGGDCGVIGAYAWACTENGWICLATDSNLGNGGREDLSLLTTLRVLQGLWPGIKGWEFAVGGFSGGGKGCFGPCAILLKDGYKVTAAFLTGVNEDYSQVYRKRYKAPASGYRGIQVFMSMGKEDQTATLEHGQNVMKSLKSNGFRPVRMETFDGGHEIYTPHLEEALKWFKEPGKR